MKKIFLIVIMFISVTAVSRAQDDGIHPPFKPNKKLEELEKVKLLEVLNMDEETTLKFFSRRNSHREKMRELNVQLKDKTKQIENLVKQEGDKQQLKNSVKDYLDLESRIPKERADFINSLSDILNEEQIAKLVVFERKFREEMRSLLFKERKKNRGNDD